MPSVVNPYNAETLLADFELYDRNVDIVSAYQHLFTQTDLMPATVAHFDRFPKGVHNDGRVLTPDFTVLFVDDHAYVGEIANIPLNDNGVDKLCRQLLQYDQITSVPGPSGNATVAGLDVLLFVQLRVGTDAARRIFTERLDNPDHEYKPSRRPVLIQYARESDRYSFQVWKGPETGTFLENKRYPDYAKFTSDLVIPPGKFAGLKVQHAFMNDRVKPLYLATVLWTKVFPSVFGAGKVEHEVTTKGLHATLHSQYGYGTVDDIREAMALLVAARLAVSTHPGKWTVYRRLLRKTGSDVHTLIAERVAEGVAGKLAKRERRAAAKKADAEIQGQGDLLEFLANPDGEAEA